MQLVTHQTGPEGQKVRRLYIEDGADIKNELYVSLVTDRATQKVALIASSEGGMDIEEVAHSTPEKIITEMIDPLTWHHRSPVAQGGGRHRFEAPPSTRPVDLCQDLQPATWTRMRPWWNQPAELQGKGELMALDAKFNFDQQRAVPPPEIVALRDLDEEDPAEVEASKFDLAYISLDGNIGCLVSGAGLAMATMDTIKAVRRRAGQLPRRGRRRPPRRSPKPSRSCSRTPRSRASGQHLRRHHEVRHHRHRRHHRLQRP